MKASSLIVLFLTLSLSVSAVIFSDSVNADPFPGTENDLVTQCNMVMYVPDLTDIWLFEGGSVDITFSETDPYDFAYSEFIGDSNGLERHLEYGAEITGIPMSDTIVEVTWMNLSTEEEHIGSFTIHVVPTTTPGTATNPVRDCIMVMYVPDLTDIWIYEGGSVDIAFSETDPYDFDYSEFIGDSNGLVWHENIGERITGTPTSDTVLEITYMDLSMEEEHIDSFTIHVVPITTTTQFLQSYMYMVEGTTSQIRLIGTVSDGSKYRADVSADGGSLSTDNVSSGQPFYFTAPMVDGSETFYVTATSSVSGTQSSYDV